MEPLTSYAFVALIEHFPHDVQQMCVALIFNTEEREITEGFEFNLIALAVNTHA